jgi:small-conductance mechanosensitive channel
MRAPSSQPRFWLFATVLLAAVLWLSISGPSMEPLVAGAQGTSPAATPSPLPEQLLRATAVPLTGAPVKYNGQILFRIQRKVGSFTPAERANSLARRIDSLVSNPFVALPTLDLMSSDDSIDIVAGDEILLSVTDADAAAGGKDRLQLATEWQQSIQQAMEDGKRSYSSRSILTGLLEAALATAVLVGLLYLIGIVYRRLLAGLAAGPSESPRWGALGRLEFYRSGGLNRILISLWKVARLGLWVLLFAVYLPLVFSRFPWTRGAVTTLLSYVLEPLAAFWQGLVAYLPSLFAVIIVAVLVWVAMRLVRLFFVEVERGSIRLGSFDPEWAPYTYRIVVFLLIMLGVIMAFPYLPGSQSPAFRGVAVFLGFLVSLSSTSAVSNIVAGVIQTYTGSFRAGDIVQIGEVTGEVVTKAFLVTRIRTFKNEDVSVPNAMTLSSHIINYSAIARSQGLVLHTSVTIGYNAPWRQVHDLLLAAARHTPDTLDDPAPFVLQTSLNDYHISYQLNVYTRRPDILPRLYSNLHQNIQDRFNEAGIEIMSPSYSALRDGNTITIPAPNLPPGYEAPPFHVSMDDRLAS